MAKAQSEQKRLEKEAKQAEEAALKEQQRVEQQRKLAEKQAQEEQKRLELERQKQVEADRLAAQERQKELDR